MTELTLIYTTFERLEDAELVCQKLLEEGLIACANLMPAGRSLYWWKSQIQKTDETFVFIKTTPLLASRAKARLEALHPYDTPCILQLPTDSINSAYAQWLKSSIFGPTPR